MSMILKTGGMLVAAILFTAGLTGSGAAVADTATNLKCKGCVGKTDLGRNAVRSKHIKDGSITARDLHKSVKPAGVAWSENKDLNGTSLVADPMVVATVTLRAPGPGYIVANVSSFVDFNGVNGRFGCALSEDGTIPALVSVIGEADSGYMPLSATRVFTVSGAGNAQVNFVCREIIAGDVEINRPVLDAVFVPKAY